jgi:amino-acid N-acetyltransferase
MTLIHDVQATPSQPPLVSMRLAHAADVDAIKAVVDENVALGHLLPRSREHIVAALGNWMVAEVDGQVVGIGSLLEMGPALVEVRSLAVLPAYRRYGVGGEIVKALVAEAQLRGYPTVFALTRAVGVFERMGFVVTEHERFPENVWRDCVLCPLIDRCDETAVVIEFATWRNGAGERGQ